MPFSFLLPASLSLSRRQRGNAARFPSGNFLVSRCIEAADAATIRLYSDQFETRYLELSLDPFGCHVVQKLLDRCDRVTKNTIIDELSFSFRFFWSVLTFFRRGG